MLFIIIIYYYYIIPVSKHTHKFPHLHVTPMRCLLYSSERRMTKVDDEVEETFAKNIQRLYREKHWMTWMDDSTSATADYFDDSTRR